MAMREVIPPVFAAAMFAGVFAFQQLSPAATVAAAPDVALGALAGYVDEDCPAPEQDLGVLPADTRVMRRRYSPEQGGASFVETLVFGGTRRASIHRPELCLPAQGFAMSNLRGVEVGGRPWRLVDVDGKGAHLTLAYTFFNQDGFSTASHVARIARDVWDRSVLNRVDRWVMCTVVGPRDERMRTRFLEAAGKELCP